MTGGTENRARGNEGAAGQAGSFGQYLRSVRVQKGIRLEAISKETRISVETLQCLENEETDRLPAEVFIKGFLRAYAKAVGADGDEAIRLFDAHPGGHRRAPGVKSHVHGREKRPVSGIVASLLAVVVIALAAYYLIPVLMPTVREETVREEPAQSPAPETAKAREIPDTREAPAAATGQGRHLLNFEAVDEARFKVIIDDGKSEEYTLKPGDRLELSAVTRFNILLSDPTSVRLYFNGEPVRTPGRGGQAVNIVLP